MKQDYSKAIERTVSYCAAILTKRYALQEADSDDLIQEGYLAALEAVPSYDDHDGRGSIQKFLNERVFGAMLTHLAKSLRRGITGGELESLSFEDVTATYGDEDGPGEEDGPWAEGWEARLGEVELDETAVSNEAVIAMLQDLPPRRRDLLRQYYGLGGGKPLTVRQLAAKRRVPVATMHVSIIEALRAAEKLLRIKGVEASDV